VYIDSGRCFVRSQNVGMGVLLLNDIAHIDEKTHYKQASTEIREKDVLLNITGASIGRTAVANKQIAGGNVNQHVCIIRPNDKLNSDFLCNYIQTKKIQNYINSLQTGGSREGLNFQQVRSFPICAPSVTEQTKISRLLSMIDYRILTQSKLIEDLQQLKSALVERLYCQHNPNFKIGDLVVQVSKRNRGDNDYSVLSVNNRLGFIEQSEQFEDRSVASEDTSNYKVVSRDDFAYNPARINVGSIARLTSFESGIVSPMYICFHTKKQILPQYLEHFFDTRYFYYEMQKRLEGSVRLCLSWEGLCNIPIAVPPIERQEKVSKRISRLADKISLEELHLDLLKSQKRYLLQTMFI
jgi:type I restriction enzyme S subunit